MDMETVVERADQMLQVTNQITHQVVEEEQVVLVMI